MQTAQEKHEIPNPDYLQTCEEDKDFGSDIPYGNGHWVKAQFSKKNFNTLETIRDALDELDIYFQFGPRACEHDPDQHAVYLYFGPKWDERGKTFLRASKGLRFRAEPFVHEPLFYSTEVSWSEVRLCSVNFHWLCKSHPPGEYPRIPSNIKPISARGHPRCVDTTLLVPKIQGQHTKYWKARVDKFSYPNGATGSGGWGGAATGSIATKRDKGQRQSGA